ncbi:MAG: hypothetical protein WDN75_08170 [Bacteroidota bacterium]
MSGDLEEKFYETEKTSLLKARINYWYQVLNYIRPFAIRKSKSYPSNNSAMFKNYFKISWRNLFKQRMYSAIKIGGFAIGIAACFLIGLYIQDELRYDIQYPERDRIYRVISGYNDQGNQHWGVWFQAPFARTIKEDFPEIEKSGRYLSSELFGAGSNQIRRQSRPITTSSRDLYSWTRSSWTYSSRRWSMEIRRTPLTSLFRW